LKPLAKAMGVHREELKNMFKDIDKDGSGSISESEFLDFFRKVLKCPDLDRLDDDIKQKKLQQVLQGTITNLIGGGDIRITKLLLDLKNQKGNEDRVVLIIGYRDVNKLRLASELQDDCIKDPDVLIGVRE
jgi:hypothetical protein